MYGRGEYTFEKIDSPRVYRSGQSVSAADEFGTLTTRYPKFFLIYFENSLLADSGLKSHFHSADLE